MAELIDLLDELESVDDQLSRQLADVKKGDAELSSVQPLLADRRDVLNRISAHLRTPSVSFVVFNRLVVSHARANQALTLVHEIRSALAEKLANGTTCRAYGARMAALLQACAPENR